MERAVVLFTLSLPSYSHLPHKMSNIEFYYWREMTNSSAQFSLAIRDLKIIWPLKHHSANNWLHSRCVYLINQSGHSSSVHIWHSHSTACRWKLIESVSLFLPHVQVNCNKSIITSSKNLTPDKRLTAIFTGVYSTLSLRHKRDVLIQTEDWSKTRLDSRNFGGKVNALNWSWLQKTLSRPSGRAVVGIVSFSIQYLTVYYYYGQ